MTTDALRRTARTALSLLDLTSLNADDDDAAIAALATAANTPFGAPAALCVYRRLVGTARAGLAGQGLGAVALATVANFPAGDADIAGAVADCQAGVAAGADEVDVVFPWRALRDGDAGVGLALVQACRAALPSGLVLKVIIESGSLAEPDLIRRASELAIDGGADFVKTSTGKVPVNATLAAARVILQTIKASGRAVGFKASGGVRLVSEAESYLVLAAEIMGEAWLSPRHFRFGASSLLGDITRVLLGQAATTAVDGY